jgi:hypothetical protein
MRHFNGTGIHSITFIQLLASDALIYEVLSHGLQRLESEGRRDGFIRNGAETSQEMCSLQENLRLDYYPTDPKKGRPDLFSEFTQR